MIRREDIDIESVARFLEIFSAALAPSEGELLKIAADILKDDIQFPSLRRLTCTC